MDFNRASQVSRVKLSVNNSEKQRYDYLYGEITQSNGSVDTTKNTGQIARIDGTINGSATKEWDQRFEYDELGNRFQSGSDNSGVGYTSVVSSEIDAATNRFVTSGATPTTYDDAGNITIDTKFRGLKYEYEANGRQTAVKLTNDTSCPWGN